MRLEVKNIGKISHAEIDMQGMTVLVGNNSTGKSTLSKSLYAVIQGFHNFNKRINDRKRELLIDNIQKWSRPIITELKSMQTQYKKRSSLLNIKAFNKYVDSIQRIDGYMKNDLFEKQEEFNFSMWMNSQEEFAQKINSLFLLQELDSILNSLDTGSNIKKQFREIDNLYEKILKDTEDQKISREILNFVVQECFSNNFSTQFNIDSTEIKLYPLENNENHFARLYRKKNSYFISDFSYMDFEENIVYIQPIHVLDESENRYNVNKLEGNIQYQLIKQLNFEQSGNEIDVVDKINEIRNKINNILLESDEEFDNEPVGEAVSPDLPFFTTEFIYKDNQLSDEINFTDVASGIKNITIIKRLIGNGVLHQNSLLIIDEPEVNLHPDWQMKLAEMLVMLRKELNIRVLINTHSPYFMRAIECYCDTYKIFDELNIYKTVKDTNTEYQYTVENVSEQENGIEYLYYQMSRPFAKLQEMIDKRNAEEGSDDEQQTD